MQGSVVAQVPAAPDTVTRALAQEAAALGVRVRHLVPREGYVESEWFDVRGPRRRDADPDDAAHVVKLRFYADPVAGLTRVAGESVERWRYDPSLPERELERMVPETHPGRALLDSVLARTRRRFAQ